MYNDNFEDFLKEQVDQHRMYPSDSVWSNIRKDLHGYTKWPALSVVTVLIISALVIGTVLNKPQPDAILAGYHFTISTQANELTAPSRNINTVTPLEDHLSTVEITRKTISAATENINSETSLLAFSFSNEEKLIPENSINSQITNQSEEEKNNSKKSITGNSKIIPETPVDMILFSGDFNTALRSSLFKATEKNNHTFSLPTSINFNKRVMAGITLPGKRGVNTTISSSPLDKLKKPSSRFDFRFYITPSMSYRIWNQGKDIKTELNSNALALETNYSVDPEKAIKHRPGAGYETGFGLGYSLSKKISLTSGLQFNISQYKVDAYSYKSEPVSISVLNDGFASDVVPAFSSLRSISGSKPITLTNRYYEISMPLGIDWKILNKNRFTIGLGAALQPTYTFDKEPLIISSNFKNYTDGSNLIRNWNANVNIETFFGYSTGNYRWQIGPQLRYQVLPTFVSNYPNKEYLFNYGVKIGVVKSLK